jgi:diacylglycerol kinase
MIRNIWRHKNLKESFTGAFRGMVSVIMNERYTKIVCFYAILVILLALALKVSLAEIAILITAITVVMIAEIFNAIAENIMNMVKPYKDPQVKRLKDAAAGMVLLASISAAAAGGLIFLPKIILILKQLS